MDYLPTTFVRLQNYWNSSETVVETNNIIAGETEQPEQVSNLNPNDNSIQFVETPNQDQDFKEIAIDYKDLRDYSDIKKDEEAGPSVTSPDINDMVNLVFAQSNMPNDANIHNKFAEAIAIDLNLIPERDVEGGNIDTDIDMLPKLQSLNKTIRNKSFVKGFRDPHKSLQKLKHRSHTHTHTLNKIEENTLLSMDTDHLLSPRSYDQNRNKGGCLSKLDFIFETFLVQHVRFYALYLSGYQFGQRGLYLFDMYTDIIVAIELYHGNEKLWFLLSSIFIALPFVLVWSASLRFIQNYVIGLLLLNRKGKRKCFMNIFINIMLIIYMFPPAGSLIIAFSEVWWTLSDIYHGVKAFIFGTGLIEAADRQTNAMKTYRKAIEIFAESIPQTILQTYIFLQLKYNYTNNINEYGINEQDLMISISVSLLNLILNFIEFYLNGKLHGMLFSEYALSVLQLAEVPMQIFVPRLAAIKKGYVEHVNFCGFQFDKASVTPLLEALHSEYCKLRTIKISVGSLSNLDLSSCKMLGYLLRNNSNQTGIKVIISRVTSLLGVQKLFEKFDMSKNGWLDFDDWIRLLKNIQSPIIHKSKEKQKRIFQQLAIRRHKKRDRIYFYDFFNKTVTNNKKNLSNFGVDVTEINYPLHFIFQQISESIEHIVENPLIEDKCKKEKEMISNLGKLFHFCIGLNCLNQIEPIINEHVFYKLLNAQYCIDKIPEIKRKNGLHKINQYETLLWAFFKHLLQHNNNQTNNIFNTQFFLNRNNIFKIEIISERIKLLEAKDFVLKLDKECKFSGFNCFEYCFLYKNNQRNKCKSFVYLFNSLLKSIKHQSDNMEKGFDKINYFNKRYEMIWNEKCGELNMLFRSTNGFYIKDIHKYTPLYYAVDEGLTNVVEFFAQYIMMTNNKKSSPGSTFIYISQDDSEEEEKKSEEFKVNWIYNQDYLHSIVHALFLTKAIKPHADLLRLLLDTEKININYYCQSFGGYLAHSLVRYRSNNSTSNKMKKYLLKCLKILNDFNYDFINNIDKLSKNNILHYAVLLNDFEVIYMMMNYYKNIKQILQQKNSHKKNVFNIAMELCKTDIVQLLLEYDDPQIVDFELFTCREDINDDGLWIKCLAQLINNSRGKVLNKFPQNQKDKLLWHTKALIQEGTPGATTNHNKPTTNNGYTYNDLENIVLHLHKNLGIPMTNTFVQ